MIFYLSGLKRLIICKPVVAVFYNMVWRLETTSGVREYWLVGLVRL